MKSFYCRHATNEASADDCSAQSSCWYAVLLSRQTHEPAWCMLLLIRIKFLSRDVVLPAKIADLAGCGCRACFDSSVWQRAFVIAVAAELHASLPYAPAVLDAWPGTDQMCQSPQCQCATQSAASAWHWLWPQNQKALQHQAQKP